MNRLVNTKGIFMHKSFMIVMMLVLHLLLPVVSQAQVKGYDYPLTNPLAATVVGTPNAYKADLPQDVPVEMRELEVFPDREIPDLLWYDKKLRYSFIPQESPAPFIFIIAGTGAGYNSQKMQVLQRAFFQSGFHVLSLSSPTHGNFIVSASSSGMPGHLLEDSQDLYRVMRLAWLQIQEQEEVEVTDFYLTGYSLGAAQAAFVSKLDDEQGDFHFKKVLMINPPVSLYNSTLILDEMLANNIPGGIDKFPDYFDRVFQAFSEVYNHGSFTNFSGDFLYEAYQERQPDDGDLAALIGLSFRLSSTNMIFTSDVMTNSGYIKPKNLVLSPTDSVTDYFKVAGRVSFLEYFRELFYPYFKAKYPTLTEPMLINNLSLERLDAYLRDTEKIGLLHNADDVILQSGELDYLLDVFGPRAKIFPHGGHCGNLEHRDTIAFIVDFFHVQPGNTFGTRKVVPLPSPRQIPPPFPQPATAVPVPLASHSMMSGRSTPDTPLHDFKEPDRHMATLAGDTQKARNPVQYANEPILPLPQADEDSPILVSKLDTASTEGESIEPADRSVESVVRPGVKFLIDVYDPIEGFNRGVYKFNAKFDEYVFLPVVEGYETIMPDFFEDRISNFFSNIEDLRNLLNAMLQLKGETTLKTLGRLLINSTFGLAGTFDQATPLGLTQQTEDFGQTLGHYGLGTGPYLVLPIFGPSNLRETSGLVVDSIARFYYLYVPLNIDGNLERGSAYTLVNSIDTRHQLKFRYYQSGSPFEYDLVRFLYKKHRELEIAK
jgi:ABC-type transporter lipoprotein component MlaA